MGIRTSLKLAAASALLMAGAAQADSISEQAVIDAQKAWGEGIVAIAKTHVMDDNGKLKINLHHSSLPFSPS